MRQTRFFHGFHCASSKLLPSLLQAVVSSWKRVLRLFGHKSSGEKRNANNVSSESNEFSKNLQQVVAKATTVRIACKPFSRYTRDVPRQRGDCTKNTSSSESCIELT